MAVQTIETLMIFRRHRAHYDVIVMLTNIKDDNIFIVS